MRIVRGRVHLAVGGPIDPTLAWERSARIDRWRWWGRHIGSVDVDGDELRIRPGLTGRIASGPFTARFRVDAVDEAARTWAWSLRVGPLRLRIAHAVLPATQVGTLRDGTLARLVLHGPLPVAIAYAPIAVVALQRLVRR